MWRPHGHTAWVRVEDEVLANDRDLGAASEPYRHDIEAVESAFASDAQSGLTQHEAHDRLSANGPNELAAAPPKTFLEKLSGHFRDPLVILLLIAIAISVVAWRLEGAEGTPFEPIVIAVIVLLNAVIGLWQEARAEQAVAALKEMTAPSARVVRGGTTLEIPAAEVVVGDVVLLTEGDAAPADIRLTSVETMKVAEASLTGESEPVFKTLASIDAEVVVGDRTNMVFASTAITSGRGCGIVTSTGMDTEIGHIATMLDSAEDNPTPLEVEIARVGKILGISVVVIAAIVIGTIMLTSEVSGLSGFVEVLLVGVSLAVAAVPEGLPAVLAVVLALGVQRLADKNAIVKNLSSVETLGSASVICTDKTGTLTKNEMTIQQVTSPSGFASLSIDPNGTGSLTGASADNDLTPSIMTELKLVIGGGSLANDATVETTDDNWTVRGDPTEAAFLYAEASLGLAESRHARFRRLGEVPFTSERKLMSTLEADSDDPGHSLIMVKGAPDVLLSRCTRMLVDGREVELSDERKVELLDDVNRMADAALRTLAVAYRRTAEPIDTVDETSEHELSYLGAVGIIDPPRSEAREAIANAHDAGIRVIMITGDHPRTAGKIAEQLDISSAPARVVTGTEIDVLDAAGFTDAVRDCSVFARVAPEHKLRIVAALQDDNKVVAMTGDGVNDAPALKAADIGVAMGITGTEVSKDAANMILADDNFASILVAVREGRSIFSSIRKFLRYLLSSNMGEVLTMFLGVLGAGLLGLTQQAEAIAVPLLATHILWINLLTDAAPALALGIDPPVEDPMQKPPRKLTDRIIDTEMQIGIFITGLAMAISTLIALDLTLAGGLLGGSGTLREAQTVAFTTLVLAQLFNAFASRSAHASAVRNLTSNPLLWAAVALSFGLQVLVVHLPYLNEAFRTTGLTVSQWLLCVGMGSVVLFVDEAKKALIRRFPGNS